MIGKRQKQQVVADVRARRGGQGAARRGADLGGAQDRRPQDRARLRAAAACQLARRQRPAHRADQGAAPLARGRDGLRDAGGAHPRQRAVRGQHLRDQDQGGGGRHRPHVPRPVHGHGPDGRAGDAARHPYQRAHLRAAGHLDRSGPERGGRAQGLYGGRRRDRALDPPHRADQVERVGAALLCGGVEADQGAAEGAERADQGHRAGADHAVGHPARAAIAAGGAGVDPRSRHHPGGHRRRRSHSPATRRSWPSTCGRGCRARSAPNT